MINPFFQNNYSVHTIKYIHGDENWFNWSFDNDKAFFRVESNYKNLAMISKIVKFDFDINTLKLSNKEIYLCDDNNSQDTIISFEDPRYFNGNLVYNKIFRNKNDGHIRKTCLAINDEELTGDGEKNCFFYNRNKYIYTINPFVLIKEREVISFNFEMPELDNFICNEDDLGLEYSISTNSFKIDDLEFIMFHTKRFDKNGILNYYQWVMEIKNEIPFAYSIEPLFFPSKQDTNQKYLDQLDKFRIMSGKPFTKYNVFYAMSAHCLNNELLIAGGLNECQSVLYKINKSDFLNWFDNNKVLISECYI